MMDQRLIQNVNGFRYAVREQEGKYVLLERLTKPSSQPYIIATGLKKLPSGNYVWASGRYFSDVQDACEVYADYIGGNKNAYMDWCKLQNRSGSDENNED